MVNRAEQNLQLLDVETRRLLDTCARIDATDLHRPTLCRGWDVAHVLSHVARNADALGNLVEWAVDGKRREPYASPAQRTTDIESGAQRSRVEVIADLDDTSTRFRQRAEALKGPAGDADVRTRTGTIVKGHQVVAMRVLEVVFHHVDLRSGFTFDHADPDWRARTLKRGVAQWDARDTAPSLTLHPRGMDPLDLGGGGPEVTGTPGQLLLWLARGHAEGLELSGTLPTPPDWA